MKKSRNPRLIKRRGGSIGIPKNFWIGEFMIFNKTVSIILSALFFVFLGLLFSSISVMFLKGQLLPIVGLFLFVIFYFITRVFYNYLRNDDHYKNTRRRSSDNDGEKYIIKGESDPKKLFIVIWLILILILTSVSLWLYSFNNGLV